MILPDINVWVALAIADHRHHAAAVEWFESIDAPGTVRFCRITQQGLFRLLTRHAVMAAYGVPALTNQQAWRLHDDLAGDDRVGRLLAEPPAVENLWRTISTRRSSSPQFWADSYLAAFAIAAGMTFVTIDKAFRQFPDLDLQLIA